MTDRIREAIFDALGSWYQTPGALPPLAVADVFAGGGSMGLEALSRGAARCTFFERGRAAQRALRANIAAFGTEAIATVLTGDAWISAAAPPPGQGLWDLVVLDPPYVDSRETGAGGRVARLLRDWAPFLCDATPTVVVLHHEAGVCYPPTMGTRWRTAACKRYGTAAITFLHGPTTMPGNQQHDGA